MEPNVLDTIKSAFQDIAGVAGLTAIAGMMAIGIAWMATIGVVELVGGTPGFILGLLGGGATVLLSLAYIVGVFRTFRNQKFESRYFTQNILWPGFRMYLANLVINLVALMAMYVVMIPIAMSSIGLSTMTMMGAGASQTGSLLTGTGILALILVPIGIGFVAYVFLALILAVPIIPLENKRAFQAIDEAIQRSKGSRAGIFLTLLPGGLIMAIAYGLLLTSPPETAGFVVWSILLALSGLYHISALNTLADRL